MLFLWFSYGESIEPPFGSKSPMRHAALRPNSAAFRWDPSPGAPSFLSQLVAIGSCNGLWYAVYQYDIGMHIYIYVYICVCACVCIEVNVNVNTEIM